MKLFYVLPISDEIISPCIEAIRLLSNPFEKHQAHITLRGPYKRRIAVDSLSSKLVGQNVIINRVGNFFESGQNTVYFGCSSPILKQIWNKPDFPFNPHITLYDGSSEDFAKKIFKVISRYHYNLNFVATKLELLVAAKAQNSFLLQMDARNTLIPEILGFRLEANLVRKLAETQRLRSIDKICDYLHSKSTTLDLFEREIHKTTRRVPETYGVKA